MIIASGLFYFDTRSYPGYALFAIGFILVGVGILLGFVKMVSEDKEKWFWWHDTLISVEYRCILSVSSIINIAAYRNNAGTFLFYLVDCL